MQKLKNQPRHLEEIAISQIVFDHSEWVSLWGFMTSRGRQKRMDFILTFDMLNKLLRFSGPAGDKIQMMLVDQLEKGVEEPSVIDLEEKFKAPLVLKQCRLEVSQTWIETPTGEWTEDTHCLSIDEVSPLLEKKVSTISAQALYKQNLSHCVDLLTRSYALYLGYLEIELDEATALQMAGLEDDLKFKMAYYAWSMNKSAA